jgi:NADH-quinone oxidoreductase subunit F
MMIQQIAQPAVKEVVDTGIVDQVVARLGAEPDRLIPILQALHDHYHYLPAEALQRICQLTAITRAQVISVATFYNQFRHTPGGKHQVRICHGTACHVKGSELIEDALRRLLQIAPGEDTDAGRQFTIQHVGCVGCCTLAPVVQIDHSTFGHQAPHEVARIINDFLSHEDSAARAPAVDDEAGVQETEIRVGLGSCCVAGGSMDVTHALRDAIRQQHASASIKSVACSGMCHQTPLVEIVAKGAPLSVYSKVQVADAASIIRRHFRPRSLWTRLRTGVSTWIDGLLQEEAARPVEYKSLDVREGAVCEFLGRQVRIATEHFGQLGPLNLDEYLGLGGFKALGQALAQSPDQIIQCVTASGLRGRGGAGFPTGRKWDITRSAADPVRYIICNGDEGDPGAFMDRMLLESFPFRVLEGMAIAALAVGAEQGFLYIRAEYPLAVQRIEQAIAMCEARGLLGGNAMNSGRPFRFEVRQGAGAFVCGEETALIASIEGQRGMPRLRPPFPAERGLWGRPTSINNVETYAMVPWIIRRGAGAFAALGTDRSKGTKVFALTGKIRRGGLIEVPMGISIRQIVEEIGGGVAPGRRFKAVQIGGPSGGCIPAELADLSVDYESLAAAGAIMGSGGLVVLDDSDCMVDMARYFLSFTQAESCGECTFCRIGTRVMLDTLQRLCEGKAQKGDLEKLEELSHQVRKSSICGLGQTAPNPVLTTLKYFRDEYEAHMNGVCPAGRCPGLIRYEVRPSCIGCTKCAQVCPAGAIEMKPFDVHAIDTGKCTRCDICRRVCPVDAIDVR